MQKDLYKHFILWYLLVNLLKYLNQTEIRALLVRALRNKPLRWTELVNEARRLSLQKYREEFNQTTRCSKRLIYEIVKSMVAQGVVEKIQKSHKKVFYKLKMLTHFELELKEIVVKTRNLLDEDMIKAYVIESRKRLDSIKAVKPITPPYDFIGVKRERDVILRELTEKINDATLGTHLISDLTELSHALLWCLTYGMPETKQLPYFYLGCFRDDCEPSNRLIKLKKVTPVEKKHLTKLMKSMFKK